MDFLTDFLLYFFISFCCYLLGALSRELGTLCRRAFFVSLYDCLSIAFLFLGFIVSVPVYLLTSCECRRASAQAEKRSQAEVHRLQAEAQHAKDRLDEYARTEKSTRDKIFTEAYKVGYNDGHSDSNEPKVKSA